MKRWAYRVAVLAPLAKVAYALAPLALPPPLLRADGDCGNGGGSAAAAAATAAAAASSSYTFTATLPWPLRSAALWSRAADRLVRDVAVAAAVALDYRLHASDAASWAACHERGAQALLRLCAVNAGVYIKLGQHIAQLPYLLPRPYVERLAVLTRAAPADDWPAVCAVLAQELGPRWRALFESLDAAPLASASLAQVHVGVLAGGGGRVAVKVQHAGLRETVAADVATLRALAALARALFPADFDVGWLADEVARNLPRELDFRLEAANMAAAGAAFAQSRLGGDVVVPAAALPPTARALVMTFEAGCAPDDAAGLAAAALPPAAVARLIAEAFAEQLFVTGAVHADPHAANLLVRPLRGGGGGGGRPQLVLLDHGLYREVPPALRLAFAALWRGIVLGDEPAIARAAAALGVAGDHRLFASMLTAQRWDAIVARGGAAGAPPLRAADRARVSADARAYAPDIVRILRAIPRDLLLLLKTNDCLRAVDLALGAPINTLRVTARYTQRALNAERARAAAAAGGGALAALRAAAVSAAQTLQMELHLAALSGAAWLAALLEWLQLPRRLALASSQ